MRQKRLKLELARLEYAPATGGLDADPYRQRNLQLLADEIKQIEARVAKRGW